jgi:hypothetical protein
MVFLWPQFRARVRADVKGTKAFAEQGRSPSDGGKALGYSVRPKTFGIVMVIK